MGMSVFWQMRTFECGSSSFNFFMPLLISTTIRKDCLPYYFPVFVKSDAGCISCFLCNSLLVSLASFLPSWKVCSYACFVDGLACRQVSWAGFMAASRFFQGTCDCRLDQRQFHLLNFLIFVGSVKCTVNL